MSGLRESLPLGSSAKKLTSSSQSSQLRISHMTSIVFTEGIQCLRNTLAKLVFKPLSRSSL